MQPKLIIIGGTLATGKSTLAKRLEQETGIKRVSMDDLKESLFDVGGYRDRAWSSRIGEIAWPAFKHMVELHLEQGDDVIAEATFLWPDDREWIECLADRHKADVYQIWMTADPRIARERFVHRAQNERHPGHCDDLKDVIEEFDQRLFNRTFIPHPIVGKTLVIDTTDFDQANIMRVHEFLQITIKNVFSSNRGLFVSPDC
jgi:predicted kinase